MQLPGNPVQMYPNLHTAASHSLSLTSPCASRGVKLQREPRLVLGVAAGMPCRGLTRAKALRFVPWAVGSGSEIARPRHAPTFYSSLNIVSA